MLEVKGELLDNELNWMCDVGVCYQLPQKGTSSTTKEVKYLFPSLGVPKGMYSKDQSPKFTHRSTIFHK